MSMSLSAMPSIGASVRRLKNSTLVAPNTVSRSAFHSAIWPRVSSGRPVSRWQRNVSFRVYSALANAASASPKVATSRAPPPRPRLANIADFIAGDARPQIPLDLGQVGEPQRDEGHLPDIRRRHD